MVFKKTTGRWSAESAFLFASIGDGEGLMCVSPSNPDSKIYTLRFICFGSLMEEQCPQKEIGMTT